MTLKATLIRGLSVGFLALVGCTNPFDGGSSVVDKTYQVGAPAALTALTTSAVFDQNQTSDPIVLPYSGAATVHPQYCEISELTNLELVGSCGCDEGVCQVRVKAPHNFHGAARFEFRLTDDQNRLSNWAGVSVTVTHVNQPPTLDPLPNTTILADVDSELIPLIVNDIDSSLVCATSLSATSSNTAAVPLTGIHISGTVPNCRMQITPAAGQVGISNLIVTVTDGSLSVSQPVTITVLPNPPSTPTGLAAVYAAGPSVQLNWNASTGPGPITYTVYRTTLSGSGYTAVPSCTNISALGCSDTSFTNGTTYYYRVRSTNATGTSTASAEVSLNPALPTAVTLSRTSAVNGVPLSWTSATGTAPLTYSVLRGTVPGGPYAAVISGLTTNSYTDTSGTPGTTYYYVLASVNAGGSINSNEVSATPLGSFAMSSVAVNAAGSVSLSWPAVSGAASYRVKYGTTSGVYSTTVTATGTSPQTITGLTPGVPVYFKVYAENATESVPATNELTAVPLGAFTMTGATATSGQVILGWGPSAGATSYRVSYGTSSGSYPTVVSGAVTSPLTITSLPNGSTYYFKVEAINASGSLEAANEVSAQPIDVPGTPTSFAATGTPGQVVLSWTASSGPGSISYDVRRGTATGVYSTIATALSATTFTDTTVTDGTTYYYTVVAHNAGGASPDASEAVVRTIAPWGLDSTIAGDSNVTLHWSPVVGATHFTVKRSTSPDSATLGSDVAGCVNITTLTCADTAVTNGTSYHYSVFATNTLGVNSTTVSISGEVAATPLDTPWNSIVAGTSKVDFSWVTGVLSPTPIDYTIRYSTVAGGAASGPVLTGCKAIAHPGNACSGTGLTNGTLYYFVIVADQGGGVTYVSPEATAMPIEALTVVSAVANSSGQVTVTWNDVAGETGYAVRFGTSTGSYPSNGGSASANVTSKIITGLMGGTTYYFRVTASNPYGTITGSPEVSVTTPVLPMAPTGLALGVTQASTLNLSWNASTGTGPITYEIFRSTVSGSGHTSIASGISSTSYQDSAVTPGVTYYYVLKATGPGGTSGFSSEVGGQGLGAFTLSSFVAANATTAHLSWNSSAGASSYVVRYGTASGVYGTTVTTNGTSPQAISGLTGGNTYFGRVFAVNALGSVPASAEMTLTTPVAPSAPVPSLAVTQIDQLDLAWNTPTGTGPMTYTVERSTSSGSGFAALSACTDLSVRICNDSVIAGTLYYYRIIATGAGGSTTSAEISGRALGAFNITGVSATSDTTASVTWASSAGASSYEVRYGAVSGSYGTTVTASGISPQGVTGLTSNTTYYFMVSASNAWGSVNATDEYSVTMPVRPVAPVLTKVGVNNGVSLSWNQPTGTLPMTYDVKRSTTSGSGYTTISSGQSLGTYLDLTANYGTTYYYIVTAINPGGSTNSNEIIATPIATFNLTAASITAAEAVSLSWPNVNGASSYTVKYGTSSGSYSTTVTNAGASPQNITGLTGGTTYYFQVVAANATESQASTNELTATALGNFTMASVTGVNQGAKLTWNSSSGASGYDIRYGTTSGSYPSSVTNQTSPATVTGLTNGITYYFRVYATNANGSAPADSELSLAPGMLLTKSAGDSQTAIVDSTLPTPIRIRVTDSALNPLSGIAVNWQVASGGGTLSSCAVTTDASGYASCEWKIGTATGANSVEASILSGASTVIFSANGTNAPANSLALSGIATSVVAGSSQIVTVRALDVYGNTALDYTGTVSWSSTDPAAVLPANAAFVAGDAGVKIFSGIVLKTSGSHTVTATDTVTGSRTGSHAAVMVGAAGADHLAIVTGNSQSAVVGTQLPTDLVVKVLDAYGNAVTGTNVTFAASAGSLSNTTAISDAAGLVTTSLTLGTTAGAQTVTVARQTTALPGSPATLTFTAMATHAAASQLAFSTAPSPSSVSQVAFAQQPTVDIQDQYGNRVLTGPDATATVMLNLQTGTGTLSGTLTKAAVAGRASFVGHGLMIDLIGTNKVLRAVKTDTSGTGGTASIFRDSGSFTITHAAASQLAFNVQPSGGTAGSAWAAQPAVHVLDASGNLVTTGAGAVANVVLAIGTNPGSGTLAGTTTVAAVGGIATFTGLSIDKVGTAYTLGASSGSLAAAVSSPFNISPGAATKLAFTTQPGNGVAGSALSIQPVVQILDANNNIVTSAIDSVTLAIGTNPGAGTLGGTVTVNAVAGVATFSGLSIQKTGTGYTLTGSAAGLTGATSSAFNISPDTAVKLSFGTQPGNGVAGTALPVQPTVRILDAYDNVVTTATDPITLSIATNPGAGSLSGSTTVNAVAGVASFSGLSIQKAGAGYTLEAVAGALPAVTSSSFNITPGAATKLSLITEPGNGVAGASLSTQPVVHILDANDNLVTSATNTVTATFGSNPGSGTLGGTVARAAVGGIATFTNLTVNKTGVGYTLNMSASGLTSDLSAAFDIASGAASKLAYGTQPGNGVAGAALSTQPIVRILDANDNIVTSATDTITLALATNPGSGVLSGTASVNAVGGVASFAGLSINKTGTGYTLAASATGLTTATSSGFNITPGTATKLSYGTQPGGAAAGAALSPQPVVRILDANDNIVTSATTAITLSIATNPGGGTLVGTATLNAVAGAATFSGLSINKTGTAYTIEANGGGLTAAVSSAFNITPGAATKLVYSTQPGNGIAGAALSAQPVVHILDANDNLVTSATNSVTLAIGTNPASGVLSGTATVAAVGGIATFGALSIDRSATGYTLAASASGLTGRTSDAFDITHATAVKLSFATQPGNGVAGSALSTQPVVRILDTYNNVVTSATDVITLALGTNPGGGTLSGTMTASAVSGVATFAGLSIEKTGAGYTLVGSAVGLTGITSSPFNITPGAATKLAVGTQPGNGVAGAALSTQPVIRIVDVNDNIVTSSTASVTLTIGINSGGGSLSGASTVNAVAGVATFSGLNINKTGTGYTLVAASSGLTGVSTSTFDITPGAATQLVYSTPPGSAIAGAHLSAQPVVHILDANNNLVTSATNNVTLSITTNPGSGTLSGTTAVTAVGGVATFSGISINKTGAGYVLGAAAAGLTGINSSAFNITPGTVTKLAFGTQPGNGAAGSVLATQPVVRVLDAYDNIVTSATNSIQIGIDNNPGSGVLTGTVTVSAVAGVATFSGLSINKTGAGYTLAASTAGLTGATSNAFNITPGAATKLAFGTQPGNGVAGTALSTQPVVRILDANDNIATGNTDSITLSISTNPGSGSLSGTVTVSAVAGVATFTNLSINKTGAGYILGAATVGLTGASSAAFNITPGTATKLAFGTQPGNGVAGSALSTQPVVHVLDANDNIVTSATDTVTLAIGANPGSGTLSGSASMTAVAGVATFSGLSINKIGTGYNLAAAAAGLSGVNSSSFNITPGTATKLAFGSQPSGGIAGAAFGTQPTVRVLDANDNLTTATTSINLSISTNPGGGTLGGTVTRSATAGVATFTGLSINKVGAGYILEANGGGLTAATSDVFNITHAAASQMVFSVQPAGATAGLVWTTQPQVQIQDAYGNLVTTGADAGAILAMSVTTGGGNLTTTTSQTAVLGTAIWTDLKIDTFGTKVITATKSNLTGSGGAGVLTVASASFTNASNPPAVPTGFAANTGDSAVAMSWSAVSGATSYNVLRGTTSGSLTLLSTSTTNSYTDTSPTDGTTYYYAVQSVGPGGTSANSSEIQARPISTPSISSVVVASGSTLTLTWSSAAGASSYEVKYSTTSGAAASGTSGCTVSHPIVTCAVSGLTAGTTYYFIVNATNAVGGGASVNSAQAAGIALATPSLTLTPANRSLSPTFSTAGATSHELMYGTVSGSYGTNINPATSGTAITGLVNGTTYFGRVRAINAYGSLTSAEVSTAPNGPRPFTISTAVAAGGQVTLTWAASTGATSYEVRYGTTSGTYGTSFATGLTGTSSIVTGLTNLTTYYFMVIASNANGTQAADAEISARPGVPTLSALPDLISPTMSTASTGNIPFTLTGPSGIDCDDVTAASGTTATMPNANLSITGSYPNCNLALTIPTGRTGATNITLTASYNSVSDTEVFNLNLVGVTAAAFSTRKLVLGYNGSSMLVRHGTTGAKANLSFDAEGSISASSIATITVVGSSGYSMGQTLAFSTFYAGASVFVETWYDQSGNSYNVTNTNTTTQPRLVNSGVIETINGKPTVNYATLGMTLENTSRLLTTINEMCVFYVGTAAALQSSPWSLNGTNTGQRVAMHVPETASSVKADFANASNGYSRQDASLSVTLNTGFTMAAWNTVTGNSRGVRYNGTTRTGSLVNYSTNVTQGSLQLGATNYGSNYRMVGKISEFIVQTSGSIVANTTSYETGAKAHFNTP